MSKVYLAARYSRHPEMRGYRDELEAMGHKVTARWIDCHTDVVGDFTASFTQEFLNENPEKCEPLGQHDINDLDAADWVISFTGGGGKGGRHVEFGYAVATGKRLMVVGPRENVFHTLASVEHFEDWPAARAVLVESTVEPVPGTVPVTVPATFSISPDDRWVLATVLRFDLGVAELATGNANDAAVVERLAAYFGGE